MIPATTPILFLSGAKDEVVPPSHMKTLYDLACHGEDAKPTRTFVVFQNGTHSTWPERRSVRLIDTNGVLPDVCG